MAITITLPAQNHRAVAYKATGDGATTGHNVSHNRRNGKLVSARTCKAFVVTGATKYDTRSERGGLLAPTDGTVVPVTSCVDNLDGTITVTTTAAIGNATVADVIVVFDQFTD